MIALQPSCQHGGSASKDGANDGAPLELTENPTQTLRLTARATPEDETQKTNQEKWKRFVPQTVFALWGSHA
jgi:hypothetical protein